ncbi:copper-binding protein [Rhodoferax sp.]|uniref:copper-binding protein n=1 Tax=Rhodoferax sp. TaxID=50421 RepID=UPI00271E51B1|nr:copper-binding protein [Rhodoferax sp.]MDO9196146.1 copper-binding protein [Rhodoferax sp.]
MKKPVTALLLLASLALAGPGMAQTASEHESHHPVVVQAAAADLTDLTDGEVRKIDKENGKITLKHGPIKNLDMPGMTMVFQVKDKTLLDKIQVGDKVRFRAETENGRYLATDIQPAN